MKKILQFSFIPANIDVALLVLRLWMGFVLFAKHGIEKLVNFSQMQQHFPDPLHLSSTFSLSFSLLSDGICSLLIVFGIATRLAALVVVINLFIVFLTMHQFSFAKEHAELVYVFLGSFLTIFIAGAGKYSIDQKLSGL
jgi:putative oxidoreductase